MSKGEHAALIRAYNVQPRALDTLPYTPEYAAICAAVAAATKREGKFAFAPCEGEIWRELLKLRKRGELPRKTNRRV